MALRAVGQREFLTGLLRAARQAWIAEAGVGMLILVAANVFVRGEDPGFHTAVLNPFLLVVLLVALRYGASAGLGTGLLAAGTHVAIVGSMRGFPAGTGLLESNDVWLPFLCVLLGLLAGGAVETLHARIGHYRDRAQAVERELAGSQKLLADLRSRVAREGLVASPSAPLPPAFIDRLKAMAGLPEERLGDALIDVLCEEFGAESVGVYACNGQELHLTASRPAPGSAPLPDVLDRSRGLVARALQSGRLATALEGRDESEPWLIAGPLVGPGGERLGAAAMRRVPFGQLGLELEVRLSALLEWTAECIGKARAGASGKRERVFGPAFLKLCIGALRERAQTTIDAVYDVVLVRIEAYTTLPPERQKATREATLRILLQTVRPQDCVCVTSRPWILAVVVQFPSSHPSYCRTALLRRLRRAWASALAQDESAPRMLLYQVLRVPLAGAIEADARAEWAPITQETSAEVMNANAAVGGARR